MSTDGWSTVILPQSDQVMKTLQHCDKAGGQLFSGLDYIAKVLITMANKKSNLPYLKVESENFSLPSLQLNWNDLSLDLKNGIMRAIVEKSKYLSYQMPEDSTIFDIAFLRRLSLFPACITRLFVPLTVES